VKSNLQKKNVEFDSSSKYLINILKISHGKRTNRGRPKCRLAAMKGLMMTTPEKSKWGSN